ncbi:hypothetical protein ACFLZH_05520 [Patescibacteria group bacterium]
MTDPENSSVIENDSAEQILTDDVWEQLISDNYTDDSYMRAVKAELAKLTESDRGKWLKELNAREQVFTQNHPNHTTESQEELRAQGYILLSTSSWDIRRGAEKIKFYNTQRVEYKIRSNESSCMFWVKPNHHYVRQCLRASGVDPEDLYTPGTSIIPETVQSRIKDLVGVTTSEDAGFIEGVKRQTVLSERYNQPYAVAFNPEFQVELKQKVLDALQRLNCPIELSVETFRILIASTSDSKACSIPIAQKLEELGALFRGIQVWDTKDPCDNPKVTREADQVKFRFQQGDENKVEELFAATKTGKSCPVFFEFLASLNDATVSIFKLVKEN